MFIGYFAVGFAAKKFARRTSLALLLAAPLFLDIHDEDWHQRLPGSPLQ